MTRPKRERIPDLRERILRAESRAEFEKILNEAKRETDAALKEYMATAEEPQPPEQLDEPLADDLVGLVASWAVDEQRELDAIFKRAMQDQQALAAAIGKDPKDIPVPAISWDPKLSKSQVSKRRRGRP